MAARPGAARHRRRRRGRRSRSGWPSAPSCSTRSSPTCTASSACSATGVLPPAVVLGHAGLHPRRRPAASASTRGRWCSRRPTSAATRRASGGCSPTAPRRRPGLGYAMENRRVLSRVLPELYREAGLHRMEPYFWALRSALLQSAPGELADPRVVVLSPGTHSETAYDQALRRHRPRLPARAGQRPRRPRRLGVDEAPLRSRPASGSTSSCAGSTPHGATRSSCAASSQLGVAGLAEAVRRGRVRVVNGLGAGVLENPACCRSCPAVCERAARRAAAAAVGADAGGAATPRASPRCWMRSTATPPR